MKGKLLVVGALLAVSLVSFPMKSVSALGPGYSVTPCPQGTTGVNGYNENNLVVSNFSATNGTVSVTTKNGGLLCSDVVLSFSTYAMPATYDKSGKFNATASPQQLFANTTVTLKAGTNGATDLKVSVPDACTNYQIDLYYGPVVNTIVFHAPLTSAKQDINDVNNTYALISASQTDCTPVIGRGSGGEVTPTAAPTVLVNTGANTAAASVAALGLAAAATIVKFPVIRTVKKLFKA